eukprot:gene8035-biopygen5410
MMTFRLQAEEEEEHASSQPHSAPLIGVPLASSQPTKVETSVNSVLHIPRDEVQRAQQRGTAHFQVAAALQCVADGRSRSLTANSVGMKKYRREQKHLPVPTDVVGVLRSEKAEVLTLDDDFDSQGRRERPIIVAASQGRTLPERIGSSVFTVGSMDAVVSLDSSALRTHALTTDRANASVGVYVPSGLSNYHRADGRTTTTPRNEEAAQPPQGRTTREIGRRQDKTAEEQHTELVEAAPASYLNESGSPAGGPVVCPRSWHVYGQKPPHVSAAAWASITPAVRLHHIRCLRSLKNMPTRSCSTSTSRRQFWSACGATQGNASGAHRRWRRSMPRWPGR